MRRLPLALALMAQGLVFALQGAAARDTLETGAGAEDASRAALAGPVPATVLRVIDGDTLLVRARIWVGQTLTTRVRIAGIDAPELKARCESERRRARAARRYLLGAVAGGRVTLRGVRNGKFAGRVVASVADGSGADLGAALLAAGLARRYAGGKRTNPCSRTAGLD